MARIALLGMWLGMFPWPGGAGEGVARADVSPLETISRQIKKSNMMFMLDTSGSMTGVPGDNFANKSEAGVDCDDGQDCRQVNAAAACQKSGRLCSNDLDCQEGICQDGNDPCSTDFDCPTKRGACSTDHNPCQYNSDCAPTSGTCSAYGSCSSIQPCPSVGQCSGDLSTCANVGGNCTVNKVCAGTTTSCLVNTDCPGSDVTSGLLARWLFDENSGGNGTALADASGNGNPASITTANGYTPAWQPGYSGSSLNFDYGNGNEGGYLAAPGAALATGLNGLSTITVMAWVKLDTPVPGHLSVIMSREDGPAAGDNLMFYISSNDTISFGASGIVNGVQASGLNIPAGTWTHVAATYDGSTGGTNNKIYLNGNMVAQANSSGAITIETNPLVIGANVNGGGDPALLNFFGALDDVRVYNRALTPGEIGQTMNSCVANVCQGGGSNVCNVAINTCDSSVSSNKCAGGDPTDRCLINQNLAGPLKTCRGSRQVCQLDSDCDKKVKGDTCGPAVSRTVVAKRVMSSIMLKNTDLLNFGLMTFWNDGYYPYYEIQGAKSTNTDTKYLQRDMLKSSYQAGNTTDPPCFDITTGPAAQCKLGNTTYFLRVGKNSRYLVRGEGNGYTEVDQAWCGPFCAMTTGEGTGQYDGSYYTYALDSASYDPSSKPVLAQTFVGKVAVGASLVPVAPVPPSFDPAKTYVYFQPRADYFSNSQNGVNRPYMTGDNACSPSVPNAQCGPQCGARWDDTRVPFLDTSDVQSVADAHVQTMLNMFEKAGNGGIMDWGRTPTGCALFNGPLSSAVVGGASDYKHSAYHYMQTVINGNGGTIPIDHDACRANYVVLITDGQANGPGDVDAAGNSLCANAACADPDPVGQGCQCQAVLAAKRMYDDLKVKTYVIGFSSDVQAGSAKYTNDNIAKAGHTGQAFGATSEAALSEAIQSAIYDAIRGSYATSPATASSGSQQNTSAGIQAGTLALETRVDFPTWKGHLNAYDANQAADVSTYNPNAGNNPVLWDAATQFSRPNFWKTRQVYTSDSTGATVQVQVDPSGTILNGAQLHALGLGSTDTEAALVARWMMGDPAMGNPAVLGAIVNSTPIDVGQPGASPLPGGKEFFDQYQTRQNLIYVGSDDGMLHAFFRNSGSGWGRTYSPGDEAFAYIPPDMLPVITRLFTQGGQKAAPGEHIFGLASSPKVKNLCVTNCTANDYHGWKTFLVMNEGWGGNDAFVLDITNPFDPAQAAPIKTVWHSQRVPSPQDVTTYDRDLGYTISVPAFFYGKGANYDDYRLLFTSGYPPGGPASSSTQGRYIVAASATDGHIYDAQGITPASTTFGPGEACKDFTAMTDVATSRNYAAGELGKLLSGYFGDTHGRLWRYVPVQGSGGALQNTGAVSLVQDFGCSQPLHFAPTVVQLDRDDAANHSGEVFLVQVTNSYLDPDTRGSAVPAQLAFLKDKRTGGNVDPATDFSPRILTAGSSPDLCAVLAGTSCTTLLPANARAASTPAAILKADGTGFWITTIWFVPPANACGKGTSYFTIHEVTYAGVISQKLGMLLPAEEPVTSVVVVGGKLVYVTSKGAFDLTAAMGTQKFSEGGAVSAITRNGGQRFSRTSWMELP